MTHGDVGGDVGPVFVGEQESPSAPWPHSSDDPTATKTLRNEFAAEVFQRFRALKGAVRTAIVEQKALGDLGSEGPGRKPPEVFALIDDLDTAYPIGPPDDPERFPDFDTCVDAIADPPDTTREDARRICGKWQQRVEGSKSMAALARPDINIDPPGPNAFDFPSDEAKIEEFMDWVDQQVNRGILERGTFDRRVSASDHWQNLYLRSAYEKGVTHADAAMVSEGIIPPEQTLENVFRAPQHADAMGMIFSRSYRELEGVTDAMGQEMSRTLAEGLSRGWNPRKTARKLNDRIDKVGITRGRMVARTESIRAHNEAALNRYADVGDRVEAVTGIVEYTTAGDRRVCPVCASLEGMQVDIENARGIIPVHPNCRCTWFPITPAKRGT